jgi:hypothetical protein
LTRKGFVSQEWAQDHVGFVQRIRIKKEEGKKKERSLDRNSKVGSHNLTKEEQHDRRSKHYPS